MHKILNLKIIIIFHLPTNFSHNTETILSIEAKQKRKWIIFVSYYLQIHSVLSLYT